MTFGLCNAPATFQTFMNNIYEDMINDGHVVIYLDDILIFAEDPQLLDTLSHEVLSRLEKHDLYLKPEKCSFMQTSIEYLSIIISEGQIRMDPAKVKGITDCPVPRTVKHVQAFLGFCNFYRRFIQDFSSIARPLFDLTKKDVPFLWTPAHDKAFQALIHAFTTAPVLALPDHSKPFRLITDASDFATGAILEQPDALNRWHPVAYHSKSLQPAERNYEIHDKELLAIVLALDVFRHYLEGRDDTLEVWSDHVNLVYFFTKQKLLDTKFFKVNAIRPTTVKVLGDTTLRQRIKSTQEYDKEVSQALESILKNGPRSLTKGLEDWNLEDGIILYRGQVYVPKEESLRRDIVKRYHDHVATGHPGRWKTYELVSREFWWPGMSIFVKSYVDGCTTCQATKV